MKKLTTSLITLALISANAAAFDWGGKFNNKTTFEGNKASDLELIQGDSISLWAVAPLSADNSFNFSAEAIYGFEYNKKDDKLNNIVDVNLLKLSKKIPIGSTGSFSVSGGRFGYSDITGLIFSQKIDGLSLDFSNKDLSVSAFGGFTGILNAHTTTILSSRKAEELKQFYSTCEKYIPFGVKLSYNSLPGNNSISVQGLGFKDLESNPADRYYGTVTAKGFFISNLGYNASSTFGTDDFDNITNLSVMNVSAFIKENAIVTLNGTYASGKQGALEPFKGFTSMTAYNSLYSPEYSDFIKAELSGSYALTEDGVVSAAAGTVFNSEFKYTGFQWQAGAQFNILNDLKLAASIGQFYGDKSDENKTSIVFNASINF